MAKLQALEPRVGYDEFQLVKVKLDYKKRLFTVEWIERFEADEYAASRIEKLKVERCYTRNAKIFNLMQSLAPILEPDFGPDEFIVTEIRLKDMIQYVDTCNFLYAENLNSGEQGRKTETKALDLSEQNFGEDAAKVLEAIRVNLYEHLVIGTLFRPSIKELKVDMETGEVILY